MLWQKHWRCWRKKFKENLTPFRASFSYLSTPPRPRLRHCGQPGKLCGLLSFFPSFFLSSSFLSFFLSFSLSFLFSFFPFLFLSLSFFLSSSQEFKRAGLRLFLTNFPSVWSSGVVGEEFRALSLSSVKLLLHDETVDTQVEVEKKLWVRFFNSISLLLLSDGLLFSLLFSSLLFQTWIETLRENALRSTSGGEQRKSLSTLFAEGKAQWTNDGQTWDKNWFETEGVDNLCDLLSQYFRKYVKQSDAVPEDIESLIRGSFFFCFLFFVCFVLFCFVLFSSYSFFFFFFLDLFFFLSYPRSLRDLEDSLHRGDLQWQETEGCS